MAKEGPPDKFDMMLAFGYVTARQVALADGQLDAQEAWDLSQRFPATELAKRGMLENGEPTARFGEAYNLAQVKLGPLMTDAEKLEMAQAFFEVCSADNSVEPSEIEVIVRAMAVLGVSKGQLAAYMRARVESGTH